MKRFLLFLLALVLVATPCWADNRDRVTTGKIVDRAVTLDKVDFFKTALTGGGVTAVDGISEHSITVGNILIASFQDGGVMKTYFYVADDDAAAESSPNRIRPDDYADFTFCWRLVSYWEDGTLVFDALVLPTTAASTAGGLSSDGVDFFFYDDVAIQTVAHSGIDDFTWGIAADTSKTWTWDTGAGTDPAVTISDTGFAFNSVVSANNVNPDAADGATLGTADLEWSDAYFADGAVIYLGNDQETLITHIPDTGLQLNAAMQLMFRDAALHIASATDGHLDLTADISVDLNTPTVVHTGVDPAYVFDGSSATDTDFWIGLTSDEGGDDDDKLQIGKGTTKGTTPYWTMDKDGNIGIGTTSPGSKLTVLDGDIALREDDNGYDAVKLWAGNSAGYISVYQDGGEKIRLYSGVGDSWINSGNVGIGTTTPTKKLDIWGGDQLIVDPTDLASESLTNGALTAGTGWSAANDCALAADAATWTYSAGTASTLTQASGDLAIAGQANRWYKITYTISAVSGTPAAAVTTAFASASTSLTLTAGAQTTYFKSATSPGNFIITATLTAGQAFTLDGLSLKEVTGGDLILMGKITGGGSNGLSVDGNGNATMSAGFFQQSVTAGITATNPGAQGDTPLTSGINEVATVGTADDAVTLPAALAGRCTKIINNGANQLEIWPASGDNAGGGVDTAVTLAAAANIEYCAYDATNWEAF